MRSQFFHINNLEKLPKLHDQLNNFLADLDDDAIVSVNTTEVWPNANGDAYSYTVLLVYRNRAKQA